MVQLHLFKWINIQSNRVAIVDKYQTNDCAAHNDYCSHSHKVHEGTVHTLITIALIYIAINKWICTPLNARLSRSGFILPSHLCCKAVEMIITLNKAHARIRRQNAATMEVYLQMCLCLHGADTWRYGTQAKRAKERQIRGWRGSDAEQKAKELQRWESQTWDGWVDGGRRRSRRNW